MPRNPDAPCAGGCGKLLWGGRDSLPAGARMCRPCRAAVRVERTCAVCAAQFKTARADNRQTCSDVCMRALRASTRNQRPGGYFVRLPFLCERCGAKAHRGSNHGPKLCADCATTRRRAYLQRRNLERRASGAAMSITEIGDRDGWRCHLCRRRVDRQVAYPHPMSASRDHLVPVVDGGTNDPTNLALAHFHCNSSRQHRGPAQLQLFG